jgi:hypothetical protein
MTRPSNWEVLIKPRSLQFWLALILLLPAPPAMAQRVGGILRSLTRRIPRRHDSAPQGSEFARLIAQLHGAEREQVIKDEILRGNLPAFLRNLKPVRLTHRFDDGTVSTATVFVMPDYLAVGSDKDYLLIPMNLFTALEVAARLGFVLPTKKLVDAIFEQSEVRLTPQPMPAGPLMRCTGYYLRHNGKIARQRLSIGCIPGVLISGHKKDVVITPRLIRDPAHLAIYGWHRPSGLPIQPLSTLHGATYADYSHGIRLVSETVLIDGKPRSFYDILADPRLSCLLSDEGAMKGLRQVFLAHSGQTGVAGENSR